MGDVRYNRFMVNKILANAPTDVRINFNFVPASLPTKAGRRLETEQMFKDMDRALNAWYYSEEE